MKKIFLMLSVIIFLILSACSSDTKKVIVTGPDVNPVELPEGPEPPEELGEIKLVLYTSESVKFTDGNSVWTWQTGKVAKAQSKIYSHENVIYQLDKDANTISSRNLVTNADLIGIDPVYSEITTKSITDDPIDLGASGVWIIEHISAQEAYDAGCLFKPYTKIYCNSEEYGNWWYNDYECCNIVVHDGEIYNQLSTGAWISVTGNTSNINYVKPGGFAVYNYSTETHSATIDGINVNWTYNFMSNAKWWLYSDTESKWYSINGYTWDGTNLVEQGSAMWDFRQLSNVMLDCGTREENGETVMYWINCNTGYVIRYVPSVDQYIEFVRLFIGPDDVVAAAQIKKYLSPIITGDDLYFIYEAQTYKYNFTTGLTSHFTGGVSELWEY